MRFLYCLIFPNGKRYFGVSNNVSRRWYDHKKAARKGKKLRVYDAIRKYGADTIRVQTLVCGSVDYIKNMEIAAIAAFKTMDDRHGYNLSPGGSIHSDASREAIRQKQTGHPVSEEARAKMRAAKRTYCDSPEGKAAWAAKRDQIIARLHSPEARAKAAAKKRGKPHSAEWVRRCVESRLANRMNSKAAGRA